MFFVPFVTRLKRPQNPEFIGYMLYTLPSFSTVFISLHKMTRWWQNYLGLHGENVAWAYWLFALHISQRIYRQRPRVYKCFCFPSTIPRSVLSDSSFRDFLCVCSKDISNVRADRICLSQTPPIWLDAWGFLCQLM